METLKNNIEYNQQFENLGRAIQICSITESIVSLAEEGPEALKKIVNEFYDKMLDLRARMVYQIQVLTSEKKEVKNE